MNATRFPTLCFLIVLMVWLASSCAKKSTDPDPRDAYVGTWVEKTTNGVPARTGLEDVLTIAKTGTATMSVDGLIRSGAFTVSPVSAGVGFKADNTPITSGTEFLFLDGSKGNVTLDKLTMTVSGDQLTMTYSFSAKSATQNAGEDYVEILTKR
ncbi:hypothetical protein ACAW74_01560 [Fibrella sp. WM1]|uniref:hypothetical protein n=1 Tax=Fibrella musci TaxID=3242485 RepID=UPI0035221540